jgi:hypothetical protein
MRPIEHVRALIADVMTSPTYRGGEVRDCIEPYLPLERCNDHQLRAVWLKLDALKRRTANRRTGFTLDELPAVAMASFDTHLGSAYWEEYHFLAQERYFKDD